jgi:hypothetical protein
MAKQKYFFTHDECLQLLEAKKLQRSNRIHYGCMESIKTYLPKNLFEKVKTWNCNQFELAENRSGLTLDIINGYISGCNNLNLDSIGYQSKRGVLNEKI